MLTPNINNFGQEPSGIPSAPVQPQMSPFAENPIVAEPQAPTAFVHNASDIDKNVLIEFSTMDINSTDILNLYRDHATIERNVLKEASDIRQEASRGHGDIKYAIAEHSESTNRDILTTGHNNQVKIDEAADKIQQRATDFYLAGQARDFDASRDLAALKASQDMAAQKLSTEILLSSERAATATALESAKVAAAVALGQSTISKEIAESKYDLSKQVAYENEKTRDLINSLKNDELNRLLIERNTDLQHCRHDYWGARDGLFNSQFAALSSQVNSQLNALNSQIAETRQGMVNFGTMAGVGQSSTSNAVR